MSYLDEPGRPDPPRRSRRHRARHDEAAPEPYPPYAPPVDPPFGPSFATNGTAVGHRDESGYRPRRARPDVDEVPDLAPVLFEETVGMPHVAPGRGRATDVPEDEVRPITEQPIARRSRAGRDLRAAIGVGLGLGALVVVPLFTWKLGFLFVIMAAIAVATWEMARAVHQSGTYPPFIPLAVGGIAMPAVAWYGGPGVLPLGLIVTVLAVMVWRFGDGVRGYQRDVTAAALIAIYVPFLGSFVAMLAAEDDGAVRVLVTLGAVVLSDTGGYVTGVFLGRHKMAPSISPGKTWEGFAGSLVWAGAVSAVLLAVLLDVAWWHGAIFGVLVAASAVLGDLGESMIKRDLDVKDMSNLLPGHGGLMDRLDSILLAAPTAFAVFALVAPHS